MISKIDPFGNIFVSPMIDMPRKDGKKVAGKLRGIKMYIVDI